MKFGKKMEYYVKKYCMSIFVGFITFFAVVCLYKMGHEYLSIVLSCLSTGVAIVYQMTHEHNAIQKNMAVIITGCDSGFGYSLSLYCRSLGFAVFASVLKTDNPNVRELLDAGVDVHELDITIENSIQDFSIAAREYLKRNKLCLYALVNNAGVMIIGDFEWQTDEQMMLQINVNIVGTMRITKKMLPLLRSDKGRIIFISSHCSVEPLPGFSVYGATKSSIRAWATALRVELKNQGIKVTCFAPGSFFLQSNIMSRQMEYFKEMEESMSMEVKHFYKFIFKKVESYFKNVATYVQPQKVVNSVLYAVFKDALLDKYPSAFYECCPWRYTYYHTLCHISPTCIRDKLINKFTKIPRC